MKTLAKAMRRLRRLGGVIGIFLQAGLDSRGRSGLSTARERALWLQRWSARMLKTLGIELRVHGQPPQTGFIAPNHLGYLDIVALASIAPQVFLSKREVADWPVVGRYARRAGTLFIDRQRRRDVLTKEEAFRQVMKDGLLLTLFLEGTSTNGEQVLPYRSSLLEPITRHGWPIAPAYVRYECEGGDARRDVCWWGDMGFVSHLWRLLAVERITATLIFGESRRPGLDRKALAEELFQETLAMSRDSLLVAPYDRGLAARLRPRD